MTAIQTKAPSPWARYAPNQYAVCRAALARGKLVPVHGGYRFGQRLFGTKIVNRILTAGEARREPDGSIVAATAS